MLTALLLASRPKLQCKVNLSMLALEVSRCKCTYVHMHINFVLAHSEHSYRIANVTLLAMSMYIFAVK